MRNPSIFLLLFVLFSANLTSQPIDTELLMERCKQAVVIVRSSDSFGSGFLIDPRGYILTNHHVIEDDIRRPSRITVEFDDGIEYSVRRIEFYENEYDVALLKIDRVDRISLPLLDYNELRSGMKVATIGHPLGIDFTINSGNISNILERFDGNWFQIDIAINPGNSGGPVLNALGQVVGMVSFRIESSSPLGRAVQNMGFAVHTKKIIELLENHRIPYHLQPLIEPLELKEQAALTEEERMRQIEMRRASAELEFERQRRELESDVLIAELTSKQREELQKIEFEQEKKRLNHQHNLEQQRMKEELQARERSMLQQMQNVQRESLRIQQQEIELEKAKLKAVQDRKNYYASLPGRLTFRVGGGAVFPGGMIEAMSSSFDPSWISGYFQAMFLYRFDIHHRYNSNFHHGRGTAIGIGFTSGTLNRKTVRDLNEWHEWNFTDNLYAHHWYNEYEAVLLIKEWIRVSGGLGTQRIKDEDVTNLKEYYLCNIGLIGRMGAFELECTFGARFGNDFNKEIWLLRVGASINLPFAKF